MARRVQRDCRAGEIDAFPVRERLGAAGEIRAIAQPHQIKRLLRRQYGAMAGTGVVGMSMGNNGALDGPRGVDMESTELAANARRRGDKNVLGSDHKS